MSNPEGVSRTVVIIYIQEFPGAASWSTVPRTPWRDDPRENMDEVRELYIEAMLRLKQPPIRSVAIGDDDR